MLTANPTKHALPASSCLFLPLPASSFLFLLAFIPTPYPIPHTQYVQLRITYVRNLRTLLFFCRNAVHDYSDDLLRLADSLLIACPVFVDDSFYLYELLVREPNGTDFPVSYLSLTVLIKNVRSSQNALP